LHPDAILDQYEWQMCMIKIAFNFVTFKQENSFLIKVFICIGRYNGDVVSLGILHLSLTEQIVFVGRKSETSRFISGKFFRVISKRLSHYFPLKICK
jgi:hypothetical protein